MQINKSYKKVITYICFIFLSVSAVAENENAVINNTKTDVLLINDVVLVDPDGDKETTVVNILIKNSLLELISQDDLNDGSVTQVIDAKKGILLGTLEPGKAPSFLILSKNPHKEFAVLLDTKKYAVLAIHAGKVVKNILKTDATPYSPEKPKVKPKRAAWLAYSPPSFILPSSYKNKHWTLYKGKSFSTLFTGVVAFDRQVWVNQDNSNKFQVGDLSEFNGSEVRAFRFGVAGTLNFAKPWVYSISAATATFDKGFDSDENDSLNFLDWRLDIPIFTNSTLSIGKQKEPISMERLMSLVHIPMQERSVAADTLLPSRNIGAVISGQTNNERVTWAGGVFNNWLDTDNDFGDNSTQVVSRVTWLPYLSEDEHELLHLGFGARYSNTQADLRFSSSPEFSKSPDFIDSGTFNANDSLTYNLEASWRKGPLWLSGEYTENNIDSSEQGSPTLSGYYLSAALSLTGEMRNYNKRNGTFAPLAVSQSVQQGGIGAWEITSRWSVFDGNSGQLNSGETDIFSVGLFWWLNPKFNISANYRWINLERCSFYIDTCEFEKGNVTGKSNGINLRLMLML
jgi:phosphate-selective porin OprO/OprP